MDHAPDTHAFDRDREGPPAAWIQELAVLLERMLGKIGPKRRVILHERADHYRPDRPD